MRSVKPTTRRGPRPDRAAKRVGSEYQTAMTSVERKYLKINLGSHLVASETLSGEAIARGGRYLVAKTLLDRGMAKLDPLSPENPLLMLAGPFAGTGFSNANRTSVGCKSPLTGGVKEANGGGTFGYALGQLGIFGLELTGKSDAWVIIHLKADGSAAFDDATPYLGMGNFAAAEALYQRYGKRVALALCGPVGEYGGLLAGVAFSDTDGRPSRLAARGGVGAVMGLKKVKAIVADLALLPKLAEPEKFKGRLKEYTRLLRDHPVIMKFYNQVGTMGMADYQNTVGGLPVRNFSAGQLSGPSEFKMGGSFINQQNRERGGKNTHACMPGCAIQCSNVYNGADGKELVSPVEYETLGLLGTNCGIAEPDQLALLNYIANDLGVDTIETGATLALLMEAGQAAWGDADWMVSALAEIAKGSEQGRLWAQGAARVGEHYGLTRIPVIKKQAVSAYDPRVAEGTGITMMVTAQGADHTAGNIPRLSTREMSLEDIIEASYKAQIHSAANDSLGLCIFGGSVTNAQQEFMVNTLNEALGTSLTTDFFENLGKETLRLEALFNQQAGFGRKDDRLPEFFYTESLPPTNHKARFTPEMLEALYRKIEAGATSS